MKTNLVPLFVLAAAFPLCVAHAQTAAVTSTSPGQATVATAAPAPNQTIYAPRLPTAAELTSAAAAQGLAIEKIEQTATQVTVVYQSSAGQTSVVSYQLLPANGAGVPPPTVVGQTTPAPTVVVEQPRVVYYTPDYAYGPGYYYPGYWYPPVALRVGFGYGWGYRGGFHGGFHR